MTPEAGQQPNQTSQKKKPKETNKKPSETEAEKKTLWPSGSANVPKHTQKKKDNIIIVNFQIYL